MAAIEQAPVPPATLRRVVFASAIGTTIEWYDFYIYGFAAALVFNKVFFPESDPLVGTLLAFATYALGFLARPLGGIVFGHFGDLIGRKKLLVLSLVLMGAATFAIGLLPTHAQIGIWAPILLTLLRLVQGFAVGGEWGGAVLMAAEYGGAKRRGFWASWPQAGVPAGNLLAAGMLALVSTGLSDEDFLTWGWRVPFLLSVILVGVGYWVRQQVAETPAFEAARQRIEAVEETRAPLVQVVRERSGGVWIGMGLRWGENIAYYILTAFSITYATDVVGLSRNVALYALMVGAACEFVAVPLFSNLADRIGRRPVYLIGSLGMVIWAFAFFRLLDTGLTPAVVAGVVVGLVLHGAMYGPQAAFISELFPTRMRYSGVSFAFQVSSIFAGSLAPIIAIELLRRTGSSTPISIYVAVTCAVSAIAAFMARETKGESFDEIDRRWGRRLRVSAPGERGPKQ
jgi:metabolite-proton symporter